MSTTEQRASKVPWVKIDDGFYENPKVASLPDRAFRVHVAGLCYSSRNLTDGQISDKAVKVLAVILGFPMKRHVQDLVDANLWQPDGRGGFGIKDFLEYNPDAASVKRVRAERSAAGRKGATSRWNGNGHDKSYGNGYGNSQWQVLDAPVVVPSRPMKTLKAVPADQEIEHEVDKILKAVTNQDDGSRGVILALARKLPLFAVAKVRESCQSRNVGAGYAVNALQSELADLEQRNDVAAREI